MKLKTEKDYVIYYNRNKKIYNFIITEYANSKPDFWENRTPLHYTDSFEEVEFILNGIVTIAD